MSLNASGSRPQRETEDISPPYPSEVVVGCRKSELALVQVRTITSKLGQALGASVTFTIATGSAAGDADKQTPLILLSKQNGGSDLAKGLWTSDLEGELVADRVQLLVHSLKDVPTALPPKCLLGAIPEREDPSDAVVMRSGLDFTSIDELPPGSVVGSSSSRRAALVRRNWPHLEVRECRGNVDTRLAKLDAPSSPFSCIILATAGLSRLGLNHRITQRLDPSIFPYAVGQGLLGIEVSADHQEILQLVRHADHEPSRWRGVAERAALRALQGGCSSPIGVWSAFEALETSEPADAGERQGGGGDNLRLQATVLDVEGRPDVFAEGVCAVRCDAEAEQLGVSVANMLLDKGARSLLSNHA